MNTRIFMWDESNMFKNLGEQRMKTLKTLGILAISGAALFFAACSETESIDESMALAEKSAEVPGVPADTCTYDGVLTDAEIDGLKLMREEEKLARDVYQHFFSLYGDVIFENIAKSEQAHMDAVLRLLEGYGKADPSMDGVGEFSDEELQALYNNLIAEGGKGLIEALKIGATIEDLDINDLQNLLAETKNEDVKRVYENLLAGSENHMRAFVNALGNLEETYKPQFISTEDFEAILAGENGNGNGSGQGSGNGNNSQGNSNGNKGTNTSNGDCDGTHSGSANGNQTGTANGNQYGGQTGNSNGNSGSKGNGRG
jgi:hypothetical protein